MGGRGSSSGIGVASATTMWQFFLYPKTTKKTEVR